MKGGNVTTGAERIQAAHNGPLVAAIALLETIQRSMTAASQAELRMSLQVAKAELERG